MKLTEEKLQAGLNKGIGFNKTQAQLLGEQWPLKNGWYRRLLDREVTEENYERFVALKGVRQNDPMRAESKDGEAKSSMAAASAVEYLATREEERVAELVSALAREYETLLSWRRMRTSHVNSFRIALDDLARSLTRQEMLEELQ